MLTPTARRVPGAVNDLKTKIIKEQSGAEAVKIPDFAAPDLTLVTARWRYFK